MGIGVADADEAGAHRGGKGEVELSAVTLVYRTKLQGRKQIQMSI
jgi:hypothetical protein